VAPAPEEPVVVVVRVELLEEGLRFANAPVHCPPVNACW